MKVKISDEISQSSSSKENDSENEFYPLQTTEPIEIIDSKSRNNSLEKKFLIFDKILYFLFLIAFILLIIQFIVLLTKGKEDLENDSNILNNNNENNNINNDGKITVAFLYSSMGGNGISRFMQVTGDNFILSGKFNVIFITKAKQKNELNYNKKIKRYYCSQNFTLIKEVLKTEKVQFLILNNYFSSYLIKAVKQTGVKAIGIYHGVYFSSMFNNSTRLYNEWKNLDLYDAFVHISADDYYFFNNLGFQRNIFIPNMYTFNQNETPQSELKTHNLMMLGRLSDKKKGLIYAIKAMALIIKEIPDAKLYLVSSDSKSEETNKLINELNLNDNIIFTPFTRNIQKYFLSSSVFFFPSLTEAFPMALNEAKAYGLPCVGFNVEYSYPFKKGIIKVEMFNYEGLAKEVIKLLKNYDYRVQKGKEAKESLNIFNNNMTTQMWESLFNSLLSGEKDFQRYRKKVKKKYFNMNIAKSHLEQQFEYIKKYNKFFSCYSLDDFTNLEKINTIKLCQNISS